MTITNTQSSVTYTGDGSNKVWNYSFLIPAVADAQVSITANGVTTILDSSLYSVSGVGNTSGGSVTYPLSGAAIDNSTTITVSRNLPAVQTTELTSQGAFDPSVVENALDYLTMLVQDLFTEVGTINQANIEAAAEAVTAAVNDFNSKYLGEHATDPTGTAAGQLYFNTTTEQMKVYNGSAWQITYNPATSGVDSFNTRTGAVVPASGDYSISQISGAAAIAASGAYSDLIGAPTLATVATSGAYNDLSGKPSLATVATSGAYLDLSGRPALAAVATSGSYNDLSNKPSIPANTTPSSSTMPVGWSGFVAFGAVVSNGSTISGANVFLAYATAGSLSNGGAQTGTWRNDTGRAVISSDFGIGTRIA